MRFPFDGAYTVTQKFGDNPDYYKQFGIQGHDGMDWGCPDGTAILAVESGRVVQQTATRDIGTVVVIWHPSLKLTSWYCHLRSISVAVGSVVTKGQIVGLSNNTGNSRGTHLHFAITQTDNDGQILNKGNGYGGFINPEPYVLQALSRQVMAKLSTFQSFLGQLTPIRGWLWEGIKTSGRFALMVFFSALVDTLTKTLAGVRLPESTKWVIALGLAGADKAIHEWRNNTGSEGAWKGLIGF